MLSDMCLGLHIRLHHRILRRKETFILGFFLINLQFIYLNLDDNSLSSRLAASGGNQVQRPPRFTGGSGHVTFVLFLLPQNWKAEAGN